MISINIAVFITLICVCFCQINGHTIHKRLLEDSKIQQINQTALQNETNLLELPTTTTESENDMSTLKDLEVPTQQLPTNSFIIDELEKFVHPNVEATELHQSENEESNTNAIKNETAIVTVLEIIPSGEELHAEKPQESSKSSTTINTNESTSTEIYPSSNETFQLIKGDCTCFSIRRPNAKKDVKKFQNATTSVLSEMESEIGILFEIAAGILPRVNESAEEKTNETSLNISQVVPRDISEVKVKNDDLPIFEDFIPFFPLESFLGGVMPHETIIVQTESEAVSPTELFPRFSDVIQNVSQSNNGVNETVTQPLVSNENNQQIDKSNEQKPIIP